MSRVVHLNRHPDRRSGGICCLLAMPPKRVPHPEQSEGWDTTELRTYSLDSPRINAIARVICRHRLVSAASLRFPAAVNW
jgi:hypothetical protein